jgi:hypothetical protein
MKKILVVLSLICFVAVNISKAQTASTATTATKQETKTEAAAVKAEAPATHGCCQKANSSCCKNNSVSKTCTSEQKAACEKMGSKAKAEAKTETESKTKGSN